MSTLQVANIHLESTANNRIQYTGSNSFVVVAGGANTLTVNSSSVDIGGVVIVSGTQVVNSSAGLNNISAIDATTADAIRSGVSSMMTVNVITSNTTYDKPAGLVGIKVIVSGGGGGSCEVRSGPGDNQSIVASAGGAGGLGIKYIPAESISEPVSVTVGLGGAGAPLGVGPNDNLTNSVGSPGGTSSFGTYITSTGGVGGTTANFTQTLYQKDGVSSNADFYSRNGGYIVEVNNGPSLQLTEVPFGGALDSYNTVNTHDSNWGWGDLQLPRGAGKQGVVVIEEYY